MFTWVCGTFIKHSKKDLVFGQIFSINKEPPQKKIKQKIKNKTEICHLADLFRGSVALMIWQAAALNGQVSPEIIKEKKC